MERSIEEIDKAAEKKHAGTETVMEITQKSEQQSSRSFNLTSILLTNLHDSGQKSHLVQSRFQAEKLHCTAFCINQLGVKLVFERHTICIASSYAASRAEGFTANNRNA